MADPESTTPSLPYELASGATVDELIFQTRKQLVEVAPEPVDDELGVAVPANIKQLVLGSFVCEAHKDTT